MKCYKARELFTAFLEGELKGRKKVGFELHLNECRRCAGELEELKGTLDLLGRLGRESLPEGFKESVYHRMAELVVKAEEKPKFKLFPSILWARGLAVGMAVLVAGACFVFYVKRVPKGYEVAKAPYKVVTAPVVPKVKAVGKKEAAPEVARPAKPVKPMPKPKKESVMVAERPEGMREREMVPPASVAETYDRLKGRVEEKEEEVVKKAAVKAEKAEAGVGIAKGGLGEVEEAKGMPGPPGPPGEVGFAGLAALGGEVRWGELEFSSSVHQVANRDEYIDLILKAFDDAPNSNVQIGLPERVAFVKGGKVLPEKSKVVWAGDLTKGQKVRVPVGIRSLAAGNQQISVQANWAGNRYQKRYVFHLPVTPAEMKPEVKYKAVSGWPLVTVSYKGEDVRKALGLLSEQAQVPIVVPEDMRGKVDISLKAVPFEKALEQIIKPLGYTARRSDNIYKIEAIGRP